MPGTQPAAGGGSATPVAPAMAGAATPVLTAMSQTEVMASNLDLSREQILDVQRINMDGASKLVAALDKPMATGKPTHQALLEAAKPVVDARDAELQKVLTVEQWKHMQTTRKAFRSLLVDQASAPTPAAAAAPKPKP